MRVIQNILSPIPEKLIPYTQSVKEWAGDSYFVNTIIPDDLKHITDLRIVSNVIRMRQLAEEKQTWVIDWDIQIRKLDLAHGVPMFYFQPDCCMYNANDTDLFKYMLDCMKYTVYGINDVVREMTIQKKVSKQNILPFSSIKHLSWSKVK